jgi:copper resistance protein C
MRRGHTYRYWKRKWADVCAVSPAVRNTAVKGQTAQTAWRSHTWRTFDAEWDPLDQYSQHQDVHEGTHADQSSTGEIPQSHDTALQPPNGDDGLVASGAALFFVQCPLPPPRRGIHAMTRLDSATGAMDNAPSSSPITAGVNMSVKSVLAVAALGLASAVTSSASAHATLQSSDPRSGSTVAKAPSQVRLKFSEALEPAFSKIKLTGPRNSEIPLAAAAVDKADPSVLTAPLPALPAGEYHVLWSAMARDGHKVKGEITFKVK